ECGDERSILAGLHGGSFVGRRLIAPEDPNCSRRAAPLPLVFPGFSRARGQLSAIRRINTHILRTAAGPPRMRSSPALRSLLVGQGLDAGEHLALEELEGGAAAGGDVRDLAGHARLLHRGGGVAATYDRG